MASIGRASTEAVLFDLDDTLFAHSRAVSRGMLTHRRAHGGAIAAADDQSEAIRWSALEEHHYHRYLSGELDVFEQRRARARGFMEPFGLDLSDDAIADEWWDRYQREYVNAWELFDDAREALEALRGLRLGIITNGVLRFQLKKLTDLGIADRFEQVIASEEFGAVKPSAEIFIHAAETFGVKPEQAAYVGDRLRTDAIGAANAGLRGIWLDRLGVASEAELAEAAENSVSVIRSLEELPGLLLDA